MSKLKLIALCSILCLTGCTSSNNRKPSNQETTITTEEVEQLDGEKIKMTGDSPVIFDGYKEMPIILDGNICGHIKINFIERLGIWDINNSQAVKEGVNFSYAINCHIDMTEYLEEHDMVNIILNPSLIDYKGNCIGTSGYVGWSGYSDFAEVYTNTTEADFEVVLQPTITDLEQAEFLIFSLTDAGNTIQFEDIYCDLNCLKNAKEGASLRVADDIVNVESINGASFDINFHDVYLELHEVKKCASLQDGSYKFYDIQYDITYNKEPTNTRGVMMFDAFNNNAIIAEPVLEVYSDVDSTKLFDSVPEALRLLYSNRSKTERYLQKFPDFLYVGERAVISTNRLLPNTTVVKPTYVRIVLKFPAEMKARSFEEMQSFSGRYLVFQIPLGVRTLEEEPR